MRKLTLIAAAVVQRLLVAAVLGAGLAATGAPSAAANESRVALVVGNGSYASTTALANPPHDARDMAAALERTGFDVIVAVDADKRQMDGALRAFADKLASAEVALFYYAGHGLQVGNQNFLVPVDARLTRERDLEFEAVRLDFVLRQMEIDREGRTTIVMLDACRDNPLARNLARTMGTRSTAVGQGLAPASTGVGTFIAYATQPGNVALDGTGRNSPFTAALLGNISTRGRNLNATMIEVRKSVIKATDGRQVPWDHSALTGDFYFVPGAIASGSTATAPAGRSDDVEALTARLKALEEEAQRRRSAGAASGAGASSGPGPDASSVVRLAEVRARLAVAEDKAKDLQRRLLDARRTEGQERDPAARQRLMQESMRIQMEMTRASLDAKKLRSEAEAIESAAAAPAADSGLGLDLTPSRSERGFNIYDTAMIAGDKIKFGAADSVAGCISICRNTPGCIAGEFSPSGSPQAACSVYRHVQRLKGGNAGATGFVKAEQGRAGAVPPVQPRNAPPTVAFEIADNVRIEGTVISEAKAPNPDACRDSCGREAGCVAFQHGRKIPVMGQCKLFSSIQSRHEDRAWRSGLRSQAAGAAAK